jgi:hypothetical protein
LICAEPNRADPCTDLNGLADKVKLFAWPNISPEVALAVVATWELLCVNKSAAHPYKPSTDAAYSAATGSLGWSCKADGSPARLLAVHHAKLLFYRA